MRCRFASPDRARSVLVLAAVLLSGAVATAQDEGARLFTEVAQPPCSTCHALQAAGASGTVGPSLDELKPEVARVKRALEKGVGAMPSYAQRLSQVQIDALACYVARATSGGAPCARR